jgi:hypothetical protein
LPDVILFWEGYEFIRAFAQPIQALACRKAIFADDLHGDSEASRCARLTAYLICDTVFPTYGARFEELFPEVYRFNRVVWVPHSASPDFLMAWNERPENAVLLSGAIDQHYPFREAMKALCDARSYPIVHHPHPGYHCGYHDRKDPRVGSGYARMLNRYRVAFTDSSRYGYVVAKFFEIPATGSLLLADSAAMPSLRKLGFIAGEHYVPVSPEEVEGQSRYVLDESNHPEIDAIRRNAQALVRNRHTTSERARIIDEAFLS